MRITKKYGTAFIISLTLTGVSGASEFDDQRTTPIVQKGNLSNVSAGQGIHQTFTEGGKGGMGGTSQVNVTLGSPGQEREKKPQDYFNEGQQWFTKIPPDYANAARCFLQAAGAAEQHIKIEAFISHAQCMIRQEDYEKASESYEEVLKIKLDSIEANRGLMNIYYQYGKDVNDNQEYTIGQYRTALSYGQKIKLKKPEDLKHIKLMEDAIRDYEHVLSLSTSFKQAATVAKAPVSASTRSIPAFARGYEAVYERFINGKLVFDNGSGQSKEFLFSDFASTLEGEFDLRGLTYSYGGTTYNVSDHLSINLGYRKAQNPAHKDKVEMWILPKFLMERDVSTAARHYSGLMGAFTSDVGILWTWGSWESNLSQCDYLTNLFDLLIYIDYACAYSDHDHLSYYPNFT